MFCQKCGNKLEIEAKFCAKCGIQITSDINNHQNINPKDAYNVYRNFDINPYHQRKFVLFDQNGGKFKATWNWAAFFFGFFWYFAKGVWGKGLLYLGISIALALMGLPIGFLFAFVFGVVGNYDYYLLKRKNTQFDTKFFSVE